VMPAITHGPIASDRPDVFDSVALAIGWSPLQSRWQRVEHGGPDAPATRFAASLANRDAFHRLEAVNLYVNRRVRFVDDRVQYGVEDFWSPAAQTLSRGKGDCEDFAIAKLAMLRRAGFATSDLYLVIAKDLVRRQDHAVAVARVDGKYWLLDSGTDELIDASQAHDYRPVMSFSGSHSWTHGYRREAPVVNIAQLPQPTYQLASLTRP
jgi:predicted transglutaminase-like cysteine proteinase